MNQSERKTNSPAGAGAWLTLAKVKCTVILRQNILRKSKILLQENAKYFGMSDINVFVFNTNIFGT
jgi:hypothetical protein